MKLSTSGLAWASLSFVHVWHHEVRGADHAQRALRFKAMLRQVLGYFDIRTSNILTDRLVHEAVQMKNFAGVSLMGHIQCFAGLAAALFIAFLQTWIQRAREVEDSAAREGSSTRQAGEAHVRSPWWPAAGRFVLRSVTSSCWAFASVSCCRSPECVHAPSC